jgi:hypothetical protein
MPLGEICWPVQDACGQKPAAASAASDRFCDIYNDGLAACLEETGASTLIVDFTWKKGA